MASDREHIQSRQTTLAYWLLVPQIPQRPTEMSEMIQPTGFRVTGPVPADMRASPSVVRGVGVQFGNRNAKLIIPAITKTEIRRDD